MTLQYIFGTYYSSVTAVRPKQCHLTDFCNVNVDMRSIGLGSRKAVQILIYMIDTPIPRCRYEG